MKIQKKILERGGGVSGGGGVWVGLGGQSGCELRIEVFVKIHKKNWGGGSGGGGRWGGGGRERGQGGCERRIEVFVKIQKKKKNWGGGGGRWGGGSGSGWGVRVDVNEELKFL